MNKVGIYEKLGAIQTELKAPKNQFNAFGKYKYRSCEDILEALKPLLSKHGLSLVITDDLILIGSRYYIKATATIYDIKNEDKKLSACAFAREEENKKGQDGSQITGSSSSYARKYALNGLFLIDDTKDSDGTNKHGKEKKKEKMKDVEANKIEIDEAIEHAQTIEEVQKTKEVYKHKWNYLKLNSKADYDELIEKAKKKIDLLKEEK
ncbi:MAG: hypothetical protein BV457_00035 [Thermoplasmata archaeon M9B1D]|nr:MAG: hypothetical protein BV457_00035 [Thermoplasmata archaeon M9B1D]PNX52247.1 MAG: hypothetical protein BV456_00260 [Thermoplasmata archaeon M8B2D]